MNNNLNNQSVNPGSERKAVTSLVLGIISVVLTAITLMGIYRIVQLPNILGLILFAVMYCFAAVPFAIIGLILGLMGLKSTKKNLAITGIVLSLIGLGSAIYI